MFNHPSLYTSSPRWQKTLLNPWQEIPRWVQLILFEFPVTKPNSKLVNFFAGRMIFLFFLSFFSCDFSSLFYYSKLYKCLSKAHAGYLWPSQLNKITTNPFWIVNWGRLWFLLWGTAGNSRLQSSVPGVLGQLPHLGQAPGLWPCFWRSPSTASSSPKSPNPQAS